MVSRLVVLLFCFCAPGIAQGGTEKIVGPDETRMSFQVIYSAAEGTARGIGQGRERGGCVLHDWLYFNQGHAGPRAFHRIRISPPYDVQSLPLVGAPPGDGRYKVGTGCVEAENLVLWRGGRDPALGGDQDDFFAFDVANWTWTDLTYTLAQSFSPTTATGSSRINGVPAVMSADGVHFIQGSTSVRQNGGPHAVFKFHVPSRQWIQVVVQGTVDGPERFVSDNNWGHDSSTDIWYLLTTNSSLTSDPSTFRRVYPFDISSNTWLPRSDFVVEPVANRSFGVLSQFGGTPTYTDLPSNVTLYLLGGVQTPADNDVLLCNMETGVLQRGAVLPPVKSVLGLCSRPMHLNNVTRTLQSLCIHKSEVFLVDSGIEIALPLPTTTGVPLATTGGGLSTGGGVATSGSYPTGEASSTSPPEIDESSTASDADSSLTVLVIIVVAAAVVCLGVVAALAFFVRRRRTRAGSSSKNHSLQTRHSSGSIDEGEYHNRVHNTKLSEGEYHNRSTVREPKDVGEYHTRPTNKGKTRNRSVDGDESPGESTYTRMPSPGESVSGTATPAYGVMPSESQIERERADSSPDDTSQGGAGNNAGGEETPPDYEFMPAVHAEIDEDEGLGDYSNFKSVTN
jgi:hypothetical protein